MDFTASIFIFFLPLLCFFFFFFFTFSISAKPSKAAASLRAKLPKSFPLIGSFPAIFQNRKRPIQWTSDLIKLSPAATLVLDLPLGRKVVLTGNPAVVEHILKTNFVNYPKGNFFTSLLRDVIGDGIFNADGDSWKFQRKVASHEFNTKSLRRFHYKKIVFIETVVDKELTDRLIPILSLAADKGAILDLQDIFQRFAFDNICKISFGYDPAYLSPLLPHEKFAEALETATKITNARFLSMSSLSWKLKRALNIGSEKHLKAAVSEVRQLAKNIINEKKRELAEKSSLDSVDLLSRFLSSGHSDEDFVTDIVISFLIAGRNTTSSALTWYFWLLHKNPSVENKVIAEIREMSSSKVGYADIKNMVYTHASLCESMRLYPPVPIDSKEVLTDDVLPDGTAVKKGTTVMYHPYAMGRLEELWGSDWEEFKPERWLQAGEKSVFVGRDSFTYPVFQAGPRICIGKEMAFLQMKRVVAGILSRFKVIPVMGHGVEPIYISSLISKMQGGFSVRIEDRI